jgi:hypothetical protein
MAVPANKKLYDRIKKKIKARVKVWPSAYASGQLVREYKRMGGKYLTKGQGLTTRKGKSKKPKKSKRKGKNLLSRWFKEKWVNVCVKKGNTYAKCGRKKSKTRGYPYCRPLIRVNKNTPKTVKEITSKKIREMCKRKRKNPYKRYFVKN